MYQDAHQMSMFVPMVPFKICYSTAKLILNGKGGRAFPLYQTLCKQIQSKKTLNKVTN